MLENSIKASGEEVILNIREFLLKIGVCITDDGKDGYLLNVDYYDGNFDSKLCLKILTDDIKLRK